MYSSRLNFLKKKQISRCLTKNIYRKPSQKIEISGFERVFKILPNCAFFRVRKNDDL